jgi:cytochrome P450
LCSKVLRDPAFVRRNTAEATGEAPARDDGGVADDGFLGMEAADHLRWRRLVAPAFRPKMLNRYRSQAEKVVHRLLDDATRRGEFDLVRDFAAPLPITIISEMLGLTDIDVPRFAHYGLVTARAIDGVRSVAQARELREANRDLDAMFTELVRRRRREPGDDVVSALLAGGNDEVISGKELVGTCQLLLTAGFETTTNMLANAMYQMLRNPSQWQLLAEDPDLAPQAVEEVLRYDPPVQYSVRAAHQPVDLDGGELPAGSVFILLLAAANRDPDIYPFPHRFDITRTQRTEHLSFLSGVHYCIGAPLARMEGEIALRALVERARTLRMAGPVRRRPTAALRGLLDFPVRVGN